MTANDEFPRVILGPDAGPELAWRNYVALEAVQASLGNIGPDVLGIAIQAHKDRVTFHIALARPSQQAHEDIKDMIAEFDAQTAGIVQGGVLVNAVVTVTDTGPQWTDYRYQRIFLARP